MKPSLAIVDSDIGRHAAAVDAAMQRLRDAQQHEQAAEDRASTARQVTARARLDLGRVLVAARKFYPMHGPRSKAWTDFLAVRRIAVDFAHDAMKYAGYVEENYPGASENAPGDLKLPTMREAGLDNRPRDGEQDETDERTDRERPDRPFRGPADDEAITEEPAPDRSALDLRFGDWRKVLAGVEVDTIITDAPFSGRTHASKPTRRDGVDPAGLTPNYQAWTAADVDEFVGSWSPRTRGWMVALSDDVLIPVWRARYLHYGRCDFQPVPCVIAGMSCRMQGDGPSSWAVYAMVGRPRTERFARWGTLSGAYMGGSQPGAEHGRGKPKWLEEYLVRDYSRRGKLVCDPLAGFGGFLISALDNGRRVIGAELDQVAHDEAMRRKAEPRTMPRLVEPDDPAYNE